MERTLVIFLKSWETKLFFFLSRGAGAKHSVLSHKTHWVGNKSEPSCEACKMLPWPSPYMEANGGQSQDKLEL